MKLELATQVFFSRTVAAGMFTHSELGALPEAAYRTANFINQIDELFDFFNSIQQNHYKLRAGAISQDNFPVDFLNAKSNLLKSLM